MIRRCSSLISAVGAQTPSPTLSPESMLRVILIPTKYRKMANGVFWSIFLFAKNLVFRQKPVFFTGIGIFYRSENVTIRCARENYI